MDWILTVALLVIHSLILSANALCAWVSYRHVCEVQQLSFTFRASVAAVDNLEAQVGSLRESLRKLAGAFHASKRAMDDERPDPTPPALTRDDLRRQHLFAPKVTT